MVVSEKMKGSEAVGVQTHQLPPESPSPPRNPVSYYVNICTMLRLRCQKTSSRGKQAKTSLLLQVQILDHVNRVRTVKNCFEISHFNITLWQSAPKSQFCSFTLPQHRTHTWPLFLILLIVPPHQNLSPQNWMLQINLEKG